MGSDHEHGAQAGDQGPATRPLLARGHPAPGPDRLTANGGLPASFPRFLIDGSGTSEVWPLSNHSSTLSSGNERPIFMVEPLPFHTGSSLLQSQRVLADAR